MLNFTQDNFKMLKYPILDCRQHICQRLAETVKLSSNFNYNLQTKLELCHKLKNDFSSFAFQVSVRDLGLFNIFNISQLTSMKSDTIIKHVSNESLEGQENIIFHVEKNKLLESVLNTTINPKIGTVKTSKDKSLLVEFSSPNIAKPFHMGHLRSTIIGNFIANVKSLTHNVKRLNYLGDWGTQIGYIKLGLDSFQVSDVNLLENPMKELYKAYTIAYNKPDSLNIAKEIFSDLEKNSSDWSEEWKKIRLLTIEHLRKTYNLLGIKFDEYICESDYRAQNISHVVDLMKANDLISMEKETLTMEMDSMKIPLLKSDGTTLYLVRDIASALDRLNRNDCDTLIYVVDKSQSNHMNSLKFAISNLTKKNVLHIPFGRVTGMSTRKGTSIFLSDIINKSIEVMAENQSKSQNTRSFDPEVTRILGVTSLIVYILKQRRNRDFNFSWDLAIQASGDSGSKLQYTHSRLNSLEKKCGVILPKEVNSSVLKESIVFDLIFELARFQDIVNNCQDELESSVLINYLFKLCNTISRSLKVLPVKGQPLDVAQQRLLLFHTAKNYLSYSMNILGLQPLDEI